MAGTIAELINPRLKEVNKMKIHKAKYMSNGDIHYLCNEAVKVNEMKLTNHLEDVTCKNCKKILGIE